MSDPAVRNVERLLPPLLRSLETLGLIGRYLNPPEVASVLENVGTPDADLKAARANEPWPEPSSALGVQLDTAADHVIASFDGLRVAATDPGATLELFKAMRHVPKALEALYPLTRILPPVNLFFLDPVRRKDPDFSRRFIDAPRGGTGVIRFGEDPDARETVWAYVPETYSPDVAHPLVMALHGGSGRGRYFLWSWLRDARSRGAILVAPTSLGQTWAIEGEDNDSPHLASILAFMRGRWNIDPARMMLTGMSDGGTFSYVSGLDPESSFTHLAPVSAAFHPMLVHSADEKRLTGLSIHIVHGMQDWMFPFTMARDAERYLKAGGANVTYREIVDLSHTYPADMNGEMLEWLANA